MRCPRCDRSIPTADRFCGRCGLARSNDSRPIDPLIGITVADRYRIERRIGVGGMGTVYLGTHTRLGQKVAIKVLHQRYAGDEHLTRRFEKEALMYGEVAHPNLVGLHEYGRTDDGTFFMVLEYCPGTALATLLRDRERLRPTLCADIVVQIAQGLGAAHTAGVVHRDLKPENVILMETRPGRYHARLLDFGIAKRLDDDGPRLTQAGMVYGTPEYMAPEQARGKEVDGRSDIYALGVLFYELLTGGPPFAGSDKLRIMNQQAHDAPERPSERITEGTIPPAIEDIVMRCLSKDPDDRYASTARLIEAVEGALETTVRVTPVPLPATTGDTERAVQFSDEELLTSGGFSDRLPGPPSTVRDAIIEVDLPTRTPPPPINALGIGAVLFCGLIATTAWVVGGDQEAKKTARSAAQTTITAPTATATPATRFAAVSRSAASDAASVTRGSATVPPSAAEKKVTDDATRAAAAGAEARRIAKARAKAEAESRAKAERDQRRARERLAARQKTALTKARKSLRKGQLKRAARTAKKVLSASPKHRDARKLSAQVTALSRAIANGRFAFETADCVGTLRALEPVLRAAPGARQVHDMVNSCKNALPPRHL